MALLLPAVLSLATGYLIVILILPFRPWCFAGWMFQLLLAVDFGLGVSSIVYFLSRTFRFDHFVLADLIVLVMLAVAWLALRSRVASIDIPRGSAHNRLSPQWLHRVLFASFVVALLAAIYAAVRRAITHPRGDGWDAFAIWNLHARFLFRGGSHWRDGFSRLIPWSHPDYPLLLPASIARFWTYLGHEDQKAAAALAIVFTFGTVALLMSSLQLLRGSAASMLGGLALLSTPFFIEQGTAQYADVPLSFYFLAAIVLLAFHDRSPAEARTQRSGLLVLAGLAAGFAAWTKNEGLLFVLAIVAARSLPILRRQQNWKSLLVLALSLAPAMLLMIWFKHAIAPPSELFADHSALHKLAIPLRYWITLKWYGKEFLRFGEWAFVPGTLLLVGFYFAANASARHNRGENNSSVRALLLTLTGYFIIYLITPYDLYWHLRFSLNRLFLQLWPSAIFLFFLAVSLPIARADSGKELGERYER
jgi:hypothetical protein